MYLTSFFCMPLIPKIHIHLKTTKIEICTLLLMHTQLTKITLSKARVKKAKHGHMSNIYNRDNTHKSKLIPSYLTEFYFSLGA